jgi:hypothetical protein
MKMISNETVLMETTDKEIVLTSHRIRQENKQWGKLQIRSIMLENVTSCEYNRKSNPLLLIGGVVAIFFAFFMESSGGLNQRSMGVVILGIGLALILIYWFTTKQKLMISSSSITIMINTNGLKEDNIKAFINKLETAKNDRYLTQH